MEGPAAGSFPKGNGPCLIKRSSARGETDKLFSEDIGRCLADFGSKTTPQKVKKNFFAKAKEDFNRNT